MGLFEKIFKGKTGPTKEQMEFFKTLTAYMPAFQNFGGSLYESELVRSAIHAKAIHASKLEVRIDGAAKPAMQTKLRMGPNSFQTWSQFMYRLKTILEMQNTAFIVPVLDIYGDVTGIFPVLPSRCEVLQYEGIPYLRYMFSTGQTASIELSACGIMTKMQYQDDLFGEKNGALLPTMDVVSIQNQGIKEGVKASATYRFMATMTNFAKTEDIAKERRRFDAENLSGEGGGLLLMPNTYKDIKQIESKPFVVNANQMKLIQTNVYNYFGVNEKILQNSANGAEMDAFYEGDIEPFSVQLSDVLSKMLFTQYERARGSRVYVVGDRLQYMSVSDKVNLAQQLGDRGAILIDEIRALFNYAPLPDGTGQHAPIRGEYYFADEPKEGTQNAGEE